VRGRKGEGNANAIVETQNYASVYVKFCLITLNKKDIVGVKNITANHIYHNNSLIKRIFRNLWKDEEE
jgi:hypothetical protein